MRPKCDSPASSNCTVFFDIWDSQTGSRSKCLIGKTVMIKGHACRILAAPKRVGVPFCTNCCRWGHPSKGCRGRVVCPICAGPHEKGLHRLMWGGCKGNPKANPPMPPTPPGTACPHKPRCVNCKGDHKVTNGKCPFWKHCRDRDWIDVKYLEARNSPSPRPRRSNNPPAA
ncbi:hypothetical protein HYPSUDRAFT_149702 [Hypholoma sublateritium FD-334 SS-4]|uniref:CCHC-type domain-containing protein n=1 Tax=Hypholoma sublateritium (strain FD-334 SS-4) TaxID=945553 RepID=A0A0D2LVU1_HYPSF|nr:hypothetical protein HYPSUDRAFT_149702 [Hypholoma sublateritium FD-334 SS-4]